MKATTEHLVRSSHPEDDAAGRVFAPGDRVPDLDTSDPYNQEKIDAGVFFLLGGSEDEPEASPDEGSADPNATDAAIRMAKDNNIDLSTIIGSGENDRITKDDVQEAVEAEVASDEEGDN